VLLAPQVIEPTSFQAFPSHSLKTLKSYFSIPRNKCYKTLIIKWETPKRIPTARNKILKGINSTPSFHAIMQRTTAVTHYCHTLISPTANIFRSWSSDALTLPIIWYPRSFWISSGILSTCSTTLSMVAIIGPSSNGTLNFDAVTGAGCEFGATVA